MHQCARLMWLPVVCFALHAGEANKEPAAVTPVSATTSAAATTAGTDVNPDEIIHKFASKEKQFSQARDNYTYRQTVKVQEVDESGVPQGKYEIVEDVMFTEEGKRIEKVVYAPMNTLQNISLSPQDEQDLRDTQPFVLTSDQVADYDIRYLGKQNADEIPSYVFSVKPKKLNPGKRYFEGQIWVDDRDFQIVKTYGKGVGSLKRGEDQQFPKFETLREQVDGKYWFPTYTHADDVLHFKDFNQRIKMLVTYKDYKKFQGKSTIHFGDVVDDDQTKPQAKPEQKPQPK